MTYKEAYPHIDQIDGLSSGDHLTVLDSYTHESGAQIDHLKVSDGYETYPGRQQVQNMVEYIDQQLVDHPEWAPPVLDPDTNQLISRNPSSTMLYSASQTLQDWFIEAAQAHATALYPIQRPNSETLTSGTPIDDISRGFFYHGLDAIGIRTRAKIMSEISAQHLHGQMGARWISLACGAAVPVIDALKECEETELIHLDLIDMNEQALAFAADLATREVDLQSVPCYDNESELRSYTTHKMNLFRGLIADDRLVREFGEKSSDMVDALGIFEYFSEKDSVAFLHNAYRLVRDDGVMVFANMLSDRPQMDFNERGVGWPKLYPRSIDEIVNIVGQAGIDPHQTRIMVPEDGIYAVIEITK